jgi:hypothetical protein
MDDSLLAEVLANPHDDAHARRVYSEHGIGLSAPISAESVQNKQPLVAPRLILADWLEERGDPRADFIRVQCELAAGVDDEDRRHDLLSRDADSPDCRH